MLMERPKLWGRITDLVSLVFLLLEVIVVMSPGCLPMTWESFQIARPEEAEEIRTTTVLLSATMGNEEDDDEDFNGSRFVNLMMFNQKQQQQQQQGNEEEDGHGAAARDGEGGIDVDPCDALLESLRMMCCCLVPEDSSSAAAAKAVRGATSSSTAPLGPGGTATVTRDSPAYYDKNGERTQYSTRESQEQILYEDAAAENQVKLLPAHHPDDLGKKCLVLDLDETLVHSSFRAVPGADFVIPVQIEDVVHFVYVMKRPGVDEFLVEMAKHYEIVVYTASLNKYADPLLDLLDPHKTIRTRLFRESCVYYEGNYVKDLR